MEVGGLKYPFPFENQCSSFFDFLVRCHPDLTPASRWSEFAGQDRVAGADPIKPLASPWHGTTVLALKYDQGVLIGGDRRATEGFQVAARRMEKVFKTDDHSAVAIAGAAGPCVEMAKLFGIELEHYEKLDGAPLSCEGKANRLGQMVKANLPMVLQGLVVVPLFVGYDLKREEGRIFKYDITGGRYEETEFHAVGSGGKDARTAIKDRFRKQLPEEEAIRTVLFALFTAAEEDVGTGGPDPIRKIFPSVKLVNVDGVFDVEEPRLASMCAELIESRREES